MKTARMTINSFQRLRVLHSLQRCRGFFQRPDFGVPLAATGTGTID